MRGVPSLSEKDVLEGDGDSVCGVSGLLGVESLLFQMGWFMSVHVYGFIHLLGKKCHLEDSGTSVIEDQRRTKLWDRFAYRASFWGGEPSLTYTRGAVLEGSLCKVGNHCGGANTMLFSHLIDSVCVCESIWCSLH